MLFVMMVQGRWKSLPLCNSHLGKENKTSEHHAGGGLKEEKLGEHSRRHTGEQGWTLEARWPRKAYNYAKSEVRSRKKLG